MFADFENQTHRLVEQGQPLLPEVLCNIHRQINADYYGPDFAADKFISYEWARIPHFYRAFYVYQYATGISAAIAIAKRIRTLGAPAIEDYKKFLRAFLRSKIIIKSVFDTVPRCVGNSISFQYPFSFCNVILTNLPGMGKYTIKQSAVNCQPFSR